MEGRDPGAPSIAETTRMRMNAATGATSTSLRYQWQMPYSTNNDKARAANEFPIVPVPKDPYDDIANVKYAFGDSNDANENWVVPFEQADAEYLMRKRDAQEKAQFDAWIMQKYDITDPAQNLMLQNIAPELFQRREEVIDSQQALVTAYAKTRLRGAKSLADLELEWLIETGRLDLPKGPIWSPSKWREEQVAASAAPSDAAFQAHRYRYGLFSPLRWLTKKDAGWTPNTANKADIRGDPASKYTSIGLPYPGARWGNEWGAQIPYPAAGSNTHNTEPYSVVPGDDYNRKWKAIQVDSRPGGTGRPDARVP